MRRTEKTSANTTAHDLTTHDTDTTTHDLTTHDLTTHKQVMKKVSVEKEPKVRDTTKKVPQILGKYHNMFNSLDISRSRVLSFPTFGLYRGAQNSRKFCSLF